MFGKPKTGEAFSRQIIGEWRAETASGDVTGAITAVFSEDGSFLTRNRLDVRGVEGDRSTQVGRFRIEPVDKQRFRLFTIDDNGVPLTTTTRTFLDRDTMVNEVGAITFRRVVD
ncbi:MAG: hypothetical protein SGJ21_02070 [Alphaproteobacteria bacterium]|nr:hypothetical protein [Alphaproteobacteria bacterium]